MAGATAALAARFHARFAGLVRSHGRYFYANPDAGHMDPATFAGNGKKNDGEGKTIYEPYTEDHWQQHLAGKYSLGICPIRDDATCCWGAIDLDVYNADVVQFSRTLTDSELPLIPCRTKSGGIHLYLFLDEPAPAELVRVKLLEWASALGAPKSEVYPKQTQLAGPNDQGNWLNMPYYDIGRAGGTLRFAVGPHGEPLTPAQFLDLAEAVATTQGLLEVMQPPQFRELGERWEGAPPCLQTMAVHGFGEGGRNKSLFNIGVYLRKRHGDDEWGEQLDSYNADFMTPPLGHKEVAQVIKNVKKKVYQYTCHDEPLSRVCNRQICLSRKYGIGRHNEEDPGVTFGPLVKIDIRPEPIWIWDINGKRIELETQELKEQQRLHTRVINELNIWPRIVKPGIWADLVRDRLQRVEVVEAPPEISLDGRIMAHLAEYCLGRPNARHPKELLHGKPFVDARGEHGPKIPGRTYFSGPHFLGYLAQQRVQVKERAVWNVLRKNGADTHFWNFAGRGLNTWHIASFSKSEVEMPIPTIDDPDAM